MLLLPTTWATINLVIATSVVAQPWQLSAPDDYSK